MSTTLTIIADDLSGQDIQDLLSMHQADALAKSPPGTSYALDLSGLQTPEITVFSAWLGDDLVSCGAIKDLDGQTGELKSMRTAPAFLRQGFAASMLQHLIQVGRDRGYTQLCLETGTNLAYEPAVKLYQKHGFISGPIYGDYVEGPNNQFFYLAL